MSHADAYIVFGEFAAAPQSDFETPHHYLLYALSGALVLEADGKRWSLPPARAALIAANHPILVTLPQKVFACSALFATSFAPNPPTTLAVFDMSSLARELLLSLRAVAKETPLNIYSTSLFQALVAEVWRLALLPSPVAMPMPTSETLKRALMLTEQQLEQDLRFENLAREVAMTPRSLTRHFMAELGMTWSQMRQRLRLLKAIELMVKNENSLTEIAVAVGFTSQSAFN
ncbi:MAG TPA: helix-turn-helix domain-containing protein, partial [Aestuariivirga sp.]